jgi:CDP-diacylglycerol pyrophosphatase
LIPTDRVTGIEDPSLLSERAPNYWEAGRFVSQPAGTYGRGDEIALAINSQFARSQNQLHIHIDCIHPDVRDALHMLQPRIDANWMHATVSGQHYDVRWLSAEDLKAGTCSRSSPTISNPANDGGRDRSSCWRRVAGRHQRV